MLGAPLEYIAQITDDLEVNQSLSKSKFIAIIEHKVKMNGSRSLLNRANCSNS